MRQPATKRQLDSRHAGADSSRGWSLFALYVWLTLMLPNVALSISEPIGAWGAAANLLLPGGFYMLALAASRRIGVTALCCFPWIFLAAFQMVLVDLFGRSPIATDMWLNLVTTNPSEAGELLAGLGWIVILIVVAYLIDLIGGIVGCVRGVRLRRDTVSKARIVGAALMAVGALCIIPAKSAGIGYTVGEGLFPVNTIVNLCRAVKVTRGTMNYHDTSRDYSFGAVSLLPDSVPQLYILVVGETSRAANWQLMGYERDTNPRLSRRDGVFTFSNVLSESNTTHKSVPMLLSSLNASTYDSLPAVKSIISAFREAGFATAVITAQKRNHSYIEFFCNEADTTLWLAESVADRPVTDMDLLTPVAERIAARAPRQMILVHAYGSHFEYRDRYPESMAHFMPDGPCKADKINRDKLINAYDNTIRTTDLILDSIASLAEAAGIRAAMIYTSDHGEDIFDGGRDNFLHASPVPTAMQVHVPMLLWLSGTYRADSPEAMPLLRARQTTPVSSSRSYFHTALQMAGIATHASDATASLLSPTYTHSNQLYLTDSNQPLPLITLLNRYREPLPASLK
ncbi:MAG: lipid A phosphoethanolamine transferase [Candidatus Amulumruptor caecigallinarius]|nr:lipid A phosphoethanolamine transferase [Candidatus Amulumruptor caecigallinarius]MCM1396863.1 lipid A phosphoethanolamine transferase [Candidatus Amulumruptor caecigallinarius]